jgi:hypothetical protein
MDFKEENDPILISQAEANIKCTYAALFRGVAKAILIDRERLSVLELLSFFGNLGAFVSAYNSKDFSFLGFARETALLFWGVVICVTAIPLLAKILRTAWEFKVIKDDLRARVADCLREIHHYSPTTEILNAIEKRNATEGAEPWVISLVRSLPKIRVRKRRAMKKNLQNLRHSPSGTNQIAG